MTTDELAAHLRSYYGEHTTYTVYDRRDRWLQEHGINQQPRCVSGHELKMEGGVGVVFCPVKQQVLVSTDGYGSSKCGRCLATVSNEELKSFIDRGSLCEQCGQTTDSEYAAPQPETRRDSTTIRN